MTTCTLPTPCGHKGNGVDKLTEIAQEINGLIGQIIAGGLSITASAPLIATPNPITGIGVISCPTCGTGTGTVTTTGSPASRSCRVSQAQ